jgi:hypothetical protein
MKKLFYLLFTFTSFVYSQEQIALAGFQELKYFFSPLLNENLPYTSNSIKTLYEDIKEDSNLSNEIKVKSDFNLILNNWSSTDAIYNKYDALRKVDKPSNFDYSPPFTIYEDNRKFLTNFDFDLKVYSGIAETTTYYVDKENGNNSNDGLTLATAFKTLITAENKVDVDRIFCTGIFEKNESASKHNDRDIQIIGLDSNTYITSKVNNQTGAWVNTSNYYSAKIRDAVGIAVDFTNQNKYSVPTNLTKVNSITEVDALQNSFYVDWANTTIYLRTFDDRVPDPDVWILDNAVLNSPLDNRKYYYENINFLGTIIAKNKSAIGGSSFYMKNCSFMKVQIWGQDESILDNCTSLYGLDDDKVNYDVSNTVINNGIEINCTLKNTLKNSNNQASTSHNNCNTIRINGNYADVTGQCIADVTGSNSWNLGCIMEDSTQNASFYLGAGGDAWLDSCTSKNNTTDIFTEATATVYINDFDTDGTNEGFGSVAVFNTLSSFTLENNAVKIYPNPMKDFLSINGIENPKIINIYNLLGKEVMSVISSNKVNVKSLPNGVYVIRIKVGLQEIIKKFIKN